MKTTITTNQALHAAALTGLLSWALLSPAVAADFSGNLRDVTITDAQASNKPPVAAFTYTQNGDIITFDASGSSDPDGTISKYKWDFGNGKSSEGPTASYTPADGTKLQVTLTVVDNSNGVALNQQIITPATKSIADDFSTNSLSDYSIISGGLNIYDGLAHANGAWKTTFAIHNKELASSDQVVDGDIYTDGAYASGGLMFRINKMDNTGYIASFSNGTIVLSSYSAGTKKWLASFNGKFAAGVYHLRVEISGKIIKIYTNGNLSLQNTNSMYSTGNFAGLYVEPYGKNALVTVDNLSCK